MAIHRSLGRQFGLESRRLAAVVESSDDAIISKTPDGVITTWNPAAQRIFGYLAEEVIGRSITVIFPAEHLHEERDILGRVVRGERISHFESVRVRKDGERVHVSVSVSPIADDDGRVVGASTIVRDISDMVRMRRREADLARSESIFQAIVEASDDAIVSKTLDGTITSWNRGAERIFGWRAAEMLGRQVAVIFPDDRLGEEAEILARIGAGERVEHFDTVRLRKDGRPVHVSATISPIFDGNGKVIGASKIARDISERIESERTIWRHANVDALTELPNRRHFQHRLEIELGRAARTARLASLLFVDLDRFKEVNDAFGHPVGDALLALAARRIRLCLRDSDVVGRFGGDEFLVLLRDVAGPHDIALVADRIRGALAEPFDLAGTRIHISGSIGVATSPGDGNTSDDLLRHADRAMYEAKRFGGNQVRASAQVLDKAPRQRMQLAADLGLALTRSEFRLEYQPVVDLRDGSIDKCEALLRWDHPVLGPVSPSTFIPLAEETGRIHEIGDWVFRQAARQANLWRASLGREVRVGLNLSPVQLRAGCAYFDRWIAELHRMDLPGDCLVVEITEGVMVDPSAETADKLAALRRAGIRIAIDDFGTGYSCLSYLSRLDIHYLKIDQTFTRALGAGPRDRALCEAIVVMAHKLGLKVIAEGVETDHQLSILREIGCDYGQGFLFARPASSDGAEALFARGLADRVARCG